MAVDFNAFGIALPEFETSQLLRRTPFEMRTDTAMKRNIGLLLAKLSGWGRVVFLDDDVTVQHADHLSNAVQLLEKYDGVGLTLGGFPDNSVVCHAYRAIGGAQETFLGGGALAVKTTDAPSFFPSIYNEDWFFLLGESSLRPVAVTGGARHAIYDPFRDPSRARIEELGDDLAEGIYWLLDQGRRLQDADVDFWHFFLRERRAFVQSVLYGVQEADLDAPERRRMTELLRGSLGRGEHISPRLCADYLKAWHADSQWWRRTWRKASARRLPLPKALGKLGLLETSLATETRKRRRSWWL